MGTFTEAQKRFYVHNDKLRNMLSMRVNKKDTHSAYPEKLSYRFPFTKARVYSCIRSLPCITGSHSEAREAVTVIRTNRCDDFVLSFCEDCLYDFLNALKEIYYNESMDEVQFNDTVILKREATEKCFFCGNKNEYEYFIQTGNYSFTLCEDCMNYFIKTVMYSSLVKELFEEEFNDLRRDIALKNKAAKEAFSENADKQ